MKIKTNGVVFYCILQTNIIEHSPKEERCLKINLFIISFLFSINFAFSIFKERVNFNSVHKKHNKKTFHDDQCRF